MTADQTIQLADGRTLGFATFGDPYGVPVVAFHGTPGSRLKFADADAGSRERGLKIISVDRWGYGLSSPRPNPTLAAFGTDVLALADALNIQTCAVLGVSGGGPFAAAAAVALGSRLRALALAAPVGLIGPDTPLSLVHRLGFRILPPLGFAIPAIFHLHRAGMLITPRLSIRLAFATAAPADRRTLSKPEVRDGLARAIATGLQPGVSGPIADMTLFSRPWQINLGAITAPVRIWMGTADRNVPQAAVQSLADAIPSAGIEWLPDAGHFWLAENSADVMTWVANRAR